MNALSHASSSVLLFVPHFILFMFTSMEPVLLVFLLLALVVALLVPIICNGAKLGIQLKPALESIEGGDHCQDFLVVGRFGSPHSRGFMPVKLALG
jgi:hypothetical protein